MFKTILTVCFWAMLLFLAPTLGRSAPDVEDRFLSITGEASKNIFIDVKGVSLSDVLKIISKESDLSFIAANDVQDRKITLYLNKVPFNQALQTILEANNLTYEMQENTNVFIVKNKYKTSTTKITRVYQLKYATVSKSKLNSTLSFASPTSNTSGGGSSGGSSSPGASTGGSGGPSSGGLEQAVQDSLSPDGKIIEDLRTNSLIITDVPDQFDIIESTIAKLDVPIPQVLIEVEMLDVSKSAADKLGISYGANPLRFTGAEKGVNYPFGRGPAAAPQTTGGSSSSSSSTSTGPIAPGFFDASGMTAEVNFLMSNTDARTLARPRILTLNNETAQIQISTDQAISLQQVQSSAGGTASQNTITPERFTTGVILKVTPQANLLTREITMAVSPKVVDVILSQVQATQASSSQIFDPVTRESDSLLKLKDGQSMVIAGLMTNQKNDTVSKIPFLGDAPVVGALFRSRVKSKDERELIIFLTPHIIDQNDQTALMEKRTSSPQALLDIQTASDRAQEVNNSLNNFDSQ
jgi:type IV pilus assembly protein PilQ